jgi:hypothetical protein
MNKGTLTPFGEACKAHQKKHNISQVELAKQIGTKAGSLSNACYGKQPIPKKWLDKMPPEMKIAALKTYRDRAYKKYIELSEQVKAAESQGESDFSSVIHTH